MISLIRIIQFSLSLLLLYVPAHANFGLYAFGCGNKAEQMLLMCPPLGNAVTEISIVSIIATYKQNCPQSEDVEGCIHMVPSDHVYYQGVLNACQGNNSCWVLAKRIQIPLCSSTIHVSNYIRINFDCNLNGQTVPTTPTTTPTTTPITTPITVNTASTKNGSYITTKATGGNNSNLSDTTPSRNSVGLGVGLALPLILISLVALVAILYRLKKLPSKVRKPLKGLIRGVQSLKERKIKTDTNRQAPNNYEYEEEDIYSSVDEIHVDDKNTPNDDLRSGKRDLCNRPIISGPIMLDEPGDVYEYSAQTPTKEDLPKILVIKSPDRPQNDKLSEKINGDHVVDQCNCDGDDPGCGDWSDDEFDTDFSDEEEENTLNTTTQINQRRRSVKVSRRGAKRCVNYGFQHDQHTINNYEGPTQLEADRVYDSPSDQEVEYYTPPRK